MVTVVVPPLQSIEPSTATAVNTVGCEILPVTIAEQPLASVTVKLYAPALTVCAPSFVYGAVPPAAVMVTVVVPPLQSIEPSTATAVNTVGCEILPVTI